MCRCDTSTRFEASLALGNSIFFAYTSTLPNVQYQIEILSNLRHAPTTGRGSMKA